MPFEQYRTECGNEVEPEWIKATVQALDAQQRGEMSWVTALSKKPKGLKPMVDDDTTFHVQPITPKEPYQAQRQDHTIGQVIQYKQRGMLPTLQDRQKAQHKIRTLT